MLGLYVCRQCRARLVRRTPPARMLQWQPRATFVSLRIGQTQGNAGPTSNIESRPAQAVPQEEAAMDTFQSSTRPRSKEGGYYARHIRGGADEAPLARRVMGAAQQKLLDAVPEDTKNTSRGPAQRIDDALRRKNVSRAWELFDITYTSRDCQALQDPEESDLELLEKGEVFSNLLSSVNNSFVRSGSSLIVTPTVLLFRYEQLGLARPEHWVLVTINFLTFSVIRAANVTPDKPERDLLSLLFELLSVWRLFFQCKGGRGEPLETISQEWQIPELESLPGMFVAKDFNIRLQDYHPGHIGNSTLGFCAVYLYTIADALPPGTLQDQAAPLARLLERLLAGSRIVPLISFMEKSRAFNALPEETRGQITQEIEAAPRTALARLGAAGIHPTKGGEPAGADLEAHYLKRIARATESKQSSGILDSLWKEIEETYSQRSDDKKIPARIYNAFLSGYLVVLSSQRSVEVWNHMIANGVKPDLQSWVALLNGCSRAQDLTGFNAMWQRMLKSGVEPDNYIWTTRVSGLMSMRQTETALATLDDMGRRWASAETVIQTPQTYGKKPRGVKNLPASAKAVNRCTKPSIEVVNAALSALVSSGSKMRQDKRISYAQKILGWAANFSIMPDVRTYNSLIQLYLRAGDQSTAFKILGQMEKAGLQSDIATYSMLIAAAMDNSSFQAASHPEQTTRILSMLSQLEAAGLQPNAHIYSTAIDRLLKQSSNMQAVKALTEHMSARNLVPSAHVYTSLVTHYFQLDPPAISAVDALTQQVLTTHRAPSDRILIDRIIEGYAAHGEIAKMAGVLNTMVRHGKMPDFNVLTAVLHAYRADGDFASARQIVQDVERGEGVARNRITGGVTGEAMFFDAARQLGLTSGEPEGQQKGQVDRRPRVAENLVGMMSTTAQLGSAGADGVEAEQGTRDADAGHLEYAGVTHDMGYEQRAAEGGNEPEPGAVGDEPQEEDVHSFLTDEPEAGAEKVAR